MNYRDMTKQELIDVLTEKYGRELPFAGEQWMHFKHKRYEIVDCPVIHSETGELFCVYKALYGTFQTYCRPLDMFMSEVDHVKYPEVKEHFRFRLISEDC